MKNLILHDVCLILPLVAVIACMKYSNYPVVLICMFIAWGMLYAPFLNGRRLYMKKAITRKRFVYSLNLQQIKMVYITN